MKDVICTLCGHLDYVNPDEVIHFPGDFKCKLCGAPMKEYNHEGE